MQFKLEIELGNDAMRTAGDLASALERVRERVTRDYPWAKVIRCADQAKIMDLNGNSVGKWEVIDDTPGARDIGRNPAALIAHPMIGNQTTGR